MKVIYRGAESIISLDAFDGQEAIVKERVEKKYRIKQLDDKLRKERTKKEIKLLTDARKVGVYTPKILHTDEKGYKIVMENILGTRIKEFLNSANEKDANKICVEIGRTVAKLHQHNIIHGDLTTSNMILKDNAIYFLDLSLGDISARIEDKGVDLNLLLKALNSTHFKISEKCWDSFLEGYKKEYSNADQVLEKVKEIKKRVRYAER